MKSTAKQFLLFLLGGAVTLILYGIDDARQKEEVKEEVTKQLEAKEKEDK